MIDRLFEHLAFEFFDFLGFLVLAGVIYGRIWIYERWFDKKT